MKLISQPKPPCDCQTKAMEFFRAHGEVWPVGTWIQCDCGKRLVLRDDQRNGLYWRFDPLSSLGSRS